MLKPLSLIWILGTLRETQSPFCVSISYHKLHSRTKTPMKKQNPRTIHVRCCTCSNQYWNQVGMSWGTCGTGEHFHRQPFLGVSSNPYCILTNPLFKRLSYTTFSSSTQGGQQCSSRATVLKRASKILRCYFTRTWQMMKGNAIQSAHWQQSLHCGHQRNQGLSFSVCPPIIRSNQEVPWTNNSMKPQYRGFSRFQKILCAKQPHRNCNSYLKCK